jgi:hypothetical protein
MNNNENDLIVFEFEDKTIRKEWDKENEKLLFSVVDIVGVLTEQETTRGASTYWKVLKTRLKQEGSELVTNCNQLKMVAADGKKYSTDVADLEQMFRIIQSIPSKKAEPIKQWLAKVGSERIEETINPELSVQRVIETYRKKGYPEKWIEQRVFKSTPARNELTAEWKKGGLKDKEYAILTNLMTKVWSGKDIPEYKEYKKLKQKDNLRDHMTTTELAINTLAEVASAEISKAENPYGFEDNKNVAIDGAEIAKEAKEKIEKRIGRKIVSKLNAKDYLKNILIGDKDE